MQTFLPYADFAISAACLDRCRLGKQRIECLQILRALLRETEGWRNHPNVVRWRGHEGALATYTGVIMDEWESRGYLNLVSKQTFLGLWRDHADAFLETMDLPEFVGAPWPEKNDNPFHKEQRASLLVKNRGWYEPRFELVRIFQIARVEKNPDLLKRIRNAK